MTKTTSIPFYINSTFRNFVGKQVKPYGLEWGLDGDAHMAYVPASFAQSRQTEMPDLKAPEAKRGIVEAYNKWAFAKELEFKSIDDILDLTVHNDGKHIHVEWKEEKDTKCVSTAHVDMEELLKKDPAANGGPPAEVWVNGVYEGTLNGEMSLSPLLLAIKRANGPGTRMTYHRYDGFIRIEKYFRGMLRKHQVFEHIMDNLIALEDPEILDSKTLIGTATVRDWIMGGQLTSRLHVQELETGDIVFVRPLYNDDLATADRHFGLRKGHDDVKIAMVKQELDRLRYLASLKHPFVAKTWGDKKETIATNTGEIEKVFMMDRVPDAMEESSVSSSVVFVEDDHDNKALSIASSTFST